MRLVGLSLLDFGIATVFPDRDAGADKDRDQDDAGPKGTGAGAHVGFFRWSGIHVTTTTAITFCDLSCGDSSHFYPAVKKLVQSSKHTSS